MVEAQVRVLEQEIQLQPVSLSDVLERSDERLGDAEEPEVLTCTESAVSFSRESGREARGDS